METHIIVKTQSSQDKQKTLKLPERKNQKKNRSQVRIRDQGSFRSLDNQEPKYKGPKPPKF